MVEPHMMRATIAAKFVAAACAGYAVLAALLLEVSPSLHARHEMQLFIFFVVIAFAAYWIGMWSGAKAKGYSGFVGLSLGLLPLAGIVVLLLIHDRTVMPVSNALPSTTIM
jgi:hypothetical protein